MKEIKNKIIKQITSISQTTKYTIAFILLVILLPIKRDVYDVEIISKDQTSKRSKELYYIGSSPKLPCQVNEQGVIKSVNYIKLDYTVKEYYWTAMAYLFAIVSPIAIASILMTKK